MGIFSGYSVFLNYKYWLNLNPFPLPPDVVNVILGFFVFFIVASLVLRLAARPLKKKQPRYAELLVRIARPLSTTGILGLLCLFFAYEQVPLLGMRLWFLLLALLFLWLVGRLAHYIVVDFPNLRQTDLERERLQKYMPKKK